MVILRQQMRSKPERTGDVLAALAAIIPDARATQGVISLDIARDLLDPDRRDRDLRGRRGTPTTGVGSRGPQGDGDVFGGARGAARSNDLRRVARPGARLSSSTAFGQPRVAEPAAGGDVDIPTPLRVAHRRGRGDRLVTRRSPRSLCCETVMPGGLTAVDV